MFEPETIEGRSKAEKSGF